MLGDMKNIPLVCIIMGSLIGPADSGAQDKPSFAGNWKVDVAQSDFGAEPTPTSMAGKVSKDTPQMFSYHVHGVEKGKPFSYSWSGAEDGSVHPFIADGKQFGQQSVKKEQDGAIIRRGGDSRDGSSFDSRDYLSVDGNTLIVEETDKSKDGTISKQKVIFHRIPTSNAKPASSQ
jgi:hypothetical protein